MNLKQQTKDIMDEYLKRINKACSSFKLESNEVKLIVWKSIVENDDTGRAIYNGELSHMLGFPKDSKERLIKITETISSSIKVIHKPFRWTGNRVVGEFFIGIGKDDFKDILSLPEAYIPYTSEGYSSNILPWLDWLLIQGNNLLTEDYIYLSRSSISSRSGFGIMVKKEGQSWKIPPEYAGTVKNNWIIRGLTSEEAQTLFSLAILRELESHL